jgi:hypothetical protein
VCNFTYGNAVIAVVNVGVRRRISGKWYLLCIQVRVKEACFVSYSMCFWKGRTLANASKHHDMSLDFRIRGFALMHLAMLRWMSACSECGVRMQCMHICNLYSCFVLATNQAFPVRVGCTSLHGQTAIDNIAGVSCVLDGSSPNFIWVAISLC